MEQVHSLGGIMCVEVPFYSICVSCVSCVWSVAGNLCWNHYGVDTTELFRAEIEALVLQTRVC